MGFIFCSLNIYIDGDPKQVEHDMHNVVMVFYGFNYLYGYED